MKAMATLGLVLLVAGTASADYQINWYCISSGGGLVSGGGYTLNCTIGQPAAGYVENASFKHWIGFWVGGLEETPKVVPTVTAAKLEADGTLVSISGKVATSAIGDYASFFYLEEADRSSGIRIDTAPGPIAGLARGSIVNVVGRLGTTAAGERQIVGPIVVISGSRTPVGTLGMPNRSLGGGDFGVPPLGQYGVAGGCGVNTVGLLVETWGKVIETGTGYVVIDDGSNAPARLDTSILSTPPAMDEYVTVIGISSLCKPALGRLRYILPRGNLDVTEY